MANATITALRASNGTMTLSDLAHYSIALRAPATLDYRGYRLTSCAAPSGGIVVLSAMNILRGYADLGWPAAINASTFRLNEAMRFAYGERTLLGDPSFNNGTLAYEASMLSVATGEEVRGEINNVTHPVAYYDPAGIESLETPGTSQVVAADASGLTISITSTINTLFGTSFAVRHAAGAAHADGVVRYQALSSWFPKRKSHPLPPPHAAPS